MITDRKFKGLLRRLINYPATLNTNNEFQLDVAFNCMTPALIKKVPPKPTALLDRFPNEAHCFILFRKLLPAVEEEYTI